MNDTHPPDDTPNLYDGFVKPADIGRDIDGQDGVVLRFDLLLAPTGDLATSTAITVTTWAGRWQHGGSHLVGAVATKPKRPDGAWSIGARSIPSLLIEQAPHGCYRITGRCLQVDENRMKALVTSRAIALARSLAASWSATADRLQDLAGE